MAEIIAVQGYAGAGKTTHSEYVRLNYTYNEAPIEHFSIGNQLRAIRRGLKNSRYTERVAKPEAPALTDEEVTEITFDEINQIPKRRLVLLDGYPREASGVTTFAEAMERGGHRLLGSLFLQITPEVSVARLLKRGARAGEFLQKSSLEEEAESRFIHDSNRFEMAMRSLSRIATVEVIDVNVGMEEARKRFIGAIGRLGVTLDGAVLLSEQK